jgi:hypothetical protein
VEALVGGFVDEKAKAGVDGVSLAGAKVPDPALRNQIDSLFACHEFRHRGVNRPIVAMDSEHQVHSRVG